MPKLVVLLRVKDGIQFVNEWLNCFEKLADEIVALDNGSTDGTYEVLKAHQKIVDITQTEGYNEGRDKNILYAMARKRNPDWCFWLDVDEIFESQITRRHLDKLMNKKLVNQYGFRRYHFIDDNHFAGSGDYFFYTCIHDRFMWRESPKGYFENFVLDSPNVKGIGGLKINTNYRLKHLGYISKQLVDKKAEIYRTVIAPGKEGSLQKMYLHNEKKIRWYDDRENPEVKKLNSKLDRMQFTSLFERGVNKITKIIKSRFGKPAKSIA
ncbi:MAG: putative glycosyltransferase [Segetibacter sp.]|nr:putative glycosyltransferase [Segetibacter sp.]